MNFLDTTNYKKPHSKPWKWNPNSGPITAWTESNAKKMGWMVEGKGMHYVTDFGKSNWKAKLLWIECQ